MASIEPVDFEPSASTTEVMIPVLEESISIGKRTVTSGLARIHVSVTQHEETVEALLKRQHILIDRVPMGMFVADAPTIRQEGNVTVIPVFEERLVTEKRLFLTEELRVRIDQTEQATRETVNLRREHAEVEYVNDPVNQPGN